MKRYQLHEIHALHDKEHPVTRVVYEETQPTRDYVAGRIIWELDKLTYKPWPRSWTAAAWRGLDRLGQWRHVRQTGCQDDCGTWYRRLPTDEPTGKFEMDEAHAHPGCTYHGPSIAWDLWIYHVMERNLERGTRFIEEDAVPYWKTREERREDRTGG